MNVITLADPVEMLEKYELYRVILDWDALHEGFRDRVEDLEITRTEVDAAGKLQPGYASKLLCDPPMRTLGRESLPRMLKATGMALVLVIDDERFAPVKERLSKRRRPMRAVAKPLSKQALQQIIKGTFANHGKLGGLLRSSKLSPRERRKIAKAAARIRWRRKNRKSDVSPAE